MRFIVNKDIPTEEEAIALMLTPRDKVAIDIETVSLENKLPLGIGIAISPTTGFYFFNIADELVCEMIEDVSLVVGHNVSFDIPLIRNKGIKVRDYDDTMLLAYSAGLLEKSLADLSSTLLLRDNPSVTTLWRKPKQGNIAVDHVKLGQICITHACNTYALHNALPRTALYDNLDKPCIELVMEMEGWGLLIDQFQLTEVEYNVVTKANKLEYELRMELGVPDINLASNPQVAEALRVKGIIGTRKTKSSKASVSEDSLKPLDLPTTNKLLRWRSLMKTLTTYVPAFRKVDHHGRIHTVFGYTETGRWKSGDKEQGKPNLQNITRDEKFEEVE